MFADYTAGFLANNSAQSFGCSLQRMDKNLPRLHPRCRTLLYYLALLLCSNVFHLPTLPPSNVLRFSGSVKRRDFMLHWFTNGQQSGSFLSGGFFLSQLFITTSSSSPAPKKSISGIGFSRSIYIILEVRGPSGPQLLGGGPSGWLYFANITSIVS